MTYAYIRVSTDAQNTLNQRMEIERFCKENNITVDEWIDDVISGTSQPEKRNLGRELMPIVKSGDLVICTELSRLGRTLLMIMNTLDYFSRMGVHLWTIKDNFRLADDITSKVISFAFGLSAEIERQLISDRTKNGLARARAEGVKIGRRKGRKNDRYKLSDYDDFILVEIGGGVRASKLAKVFGVSSKTVKAHYLRLLEKNI